MEGGGVCASRPEKSSMEEGEREGAGPLSVSPYRSARLLRVDLTGGVEALVVSRRWG